MSVRPSRVDTHGSAKASMSMSFSERQDRAAVCQGRSNAAASSRQAAVHPGPFAEEELDSGLDEAESVISRLSHAPSLHPSMAGSVLSQACSEVTIGAGDETNYWDYQHREATRADLGHRCRECKQPFRRIGEPMTERRGARVSMRYHASCFSGFADPRSQAESSHHTGRLAGTQHVAAPPGKASGKMRTSAHFDSGSDSRRLAERPSREASGKLAGLGMHSGGFRNKSSKPPPDAAGVEDGQSLPVAAQRTPGTLTVEALAMHLQMVGSHDAACGKEQYRRSGHDSTAGDPPDRPLS